MSKLYLIVGLMLIALILKSCGPNDQDYSDAAKSVCTCVEDQRKSRLATGQNANDNLLYAICTAPVEHDMNIDIRDKKFTDALKISCSDLYKVHENIVNQSIPLSE